MKKVLSFMLVLAMLMTQLVMPAFADVAYDDEWYDEDPYAGLKVESMTVTVNKPLIKNASGWYEQVYDENGEPTDEEFFYYDIDYADIYVTVVYDNGDVEEGAPYDLYDGVEIYNDQYENPWGLGKHSVTYLYRDFETTFEVEIVETPVKSISAVAQKKLVDGFDGGKEIYVDEDGNEIESTYYYYMQAEPYFTVTMKDGSVVKGNEFEIYDQTGYWLSDNVDQDEKPFKIGKNKIEFTLMGASCECVFEIIPNPYKGVTLKGENEAYLVFEGIDKKDTYETKIVDIFYYEFIEEGCMDADICTEDGKYYYVGLNFDVDKNGNPCLNKNVSLNIGPFTTNTVETCNYFKAAYVSESVLFSTIEYYMTSKMIGDKPFTGYKAEAPDIDHLVALSTYATTNYSDCEYTDYGELYTLTVEQTEDNIETVFGITGVKVKDSAFYKNKLFGGKVKVEQYWNSMIDENEKMTFQDGKWIVTADMVDFDTNYEAGALAGKITLVLNGDGTVYSIDIEEVELQLGDVNCDGEITALDARAILQYVAGIIDEYGLNLDYADVNGDGEVTALDARSVLQRVAGLIK